MLVSRYFICPPNGGHSTRRPITACRAAIYAALSPAPSTDADRDKAASFVAKLSAYQPNTKTVSEARERIKKLHGGRPPKVLDLFAGGGAIPLEAARLGCESHAVDYNPVAHLIELCTLVYPQTFGSSLADEFQQWGAVILDRMLEEIGDLYPPVDLPRTDEVSDQAQLFGQGNVRSSPPSRSRVLYLGANGPMPTTGLQSASPIGTAVMAAEEGRCHRCGAANRGW